MDSSTVNQGQPDIKPNIPISSSPNSHRLVLIFTVIGILVLIILILIANYFLNFLPFTQLPHKFIQRTNTINPKLADKAQKDLPAFIQTNIRSSLIPSSFEIKSIINSQGITLDPNQFNASWNSNNGEIIVISTRYNDQLVIEDRSILLTLPVSSSLTATSAANLTKQYLTIQTDGTWNCNEANLGPNNSPTATICENFWVDSQKIKHGAGAMSPISLNSKKTSVFACQLYPQSKAYSWKSCNFYNQ